MLYLLVYITVVFVCMHFRRIGSNYNIVVNGLDNFKHNLLMILLCLGHSVVNSAEYGVTMLSS
jgi:hypothetical protein